MKYIHFLFIFMLFPGQRIFAQDLDKILNSLSVSSINNYTLGTFKGTTILNGQSVDMPGHKDLQFNISHRFGAINQGIYGFFGLDQGTTRIGFEYGLKDRVSLSLGRNNYDKIYDGAIKIKVIKQQTGIKHIPVTVSVYSAIFVKTIKWEVPDRENLFSSRQSYTTQLLIARKFNQKLSLQLSPSYIHKNLVPTPEDQNNIFAIGSGGRYKLTKRLSVNLEHFYLLPGETANDYANSFSLGVDIESAGHLFQIMATNSQYMFARGYITETTGEWSKGDIYFGFNIYRIFSTGKKNKARKSNAEEFIK